jgi:hypothetical protein
MNQTRDPIFVVGVPRSGTTLLAAMLGAHSRLSCGPETHFFSKGLSRRFAARRFRRAWPARAVEELFGTVTNTRPLPEEHGLGREEVTSFLARRAPSAPAVLEALTELFMLKAGKQRWVEKTPRHLIHLPELRQHYPRAPVIRIVRDPRDAALSIFKAPWQFHSFLEALLYWHYLDARSDAFYPADPCTYTMRYEDLLLHPQEELRNICAFLGEAYEPGMLDTSKSSQQVNRTAESWKEKIAGPLDTARVRVWERELTAGQQLETEAVVGNRLRAFGYPADTEFERYVALFPMHALASYPGLVSEAVSRRVRFWPVNAAERPEEKLYVGHPDADDWLGYDRLTRLRQTFAVLADVLRARWSGIRFRWVTGPEAHSSGHCAALLSLVLRRHLAADSPWLLGARQPVNAWL